VLLLLSLESPREHSQHKHRDQKRKAHKEPAIDQNPPHDVAAALGDDFQRCLVPIENV
jgi:hypothetical protein